MLNIQRMIFQSCVLKRWPYVILSQLYYVLYPVLCVGYFKLESAKYTHTTMFLYKILDRLSMIEF